MRPLLLYPHGRCGEAVKDLVQPARAHARPVEAQPDSPTSTLAFYRRVLRLRAQLPTTERLTWAQTGKDTVHFARQGGCTR